VKSIISMYFDVTGFSKDNINVRKDLADLCNRLYYLILHRGIVSFIVIFVVFHKKLSSNNNCCTTHR
jgi:hypothetical protein